MRFDIITIFPKIFDSYKTVLTKENVVLIHGKIDSKNERPVIIVEKISVFNSFSA